MKPIEALGGAIFIVVIVGLSTTGPRRATAPPQPEVHKAQCAELADGALPDPTCTPGVIDALVTQENLQHTICARGYTDGVPLVSAALRARARAAYSASAPQDLDLLVPLALGGSTTDIRNLWPQAGPTVIAKNTVEKRLHHDVCVGKISLADAQRRISVDWRLA